MNSRIVPLQFSKHDDGYGSLANTTIRYARFGSFELDLQRRELYRTGIRVALPRKVLEVLLVLIEKPGDVVTREALRARLWPPDLHVNFNANVNTAVNKLRQVLGDATSQPTYVETIPRRGYVFIARTEFSDQPGARVPGAETTVQFTESNSERISESGRSLFEAARQSPWLAIGITGLLAIGIVLGAMVAYMALHR